MAQGRNRTGVHHALILWLTVLAPWPLAAEVTQSGDISFTVQHEVYAEARPPEAYRTMTAEIDQWWNPEHSWSGEARNLYFDARQGGCFCERLPEDGFVEHLRIVYMAPGREIRFDGALGPLQQMQAQGRMIWKVEAAEGGSRITFTYLVFGHPEGGLLRIAPAVDVVIGEQLQRLGERLSRD